MLLLGVLGVASLSVVVILNGLRRAPEAYEDQSGFHIVPERPRCSGASVLPRRAKKRDVVSGRFNLPLPVGAGHFKA
jgi:hypothetical protein